MISDLVGNMYITIQLWQTCEYVFVTLYEITWTFRSKRSGQQHIVNKFLWMKNKKY